jgi:hypothetical protein
MSPLPTTTVRRSGRVYAGHYSPMGVEHWLELGWDLARAAELATYGHQAREVVMLDGDAVTRLRHYPYHSPTGFEWGYNGSGPAELARCILLDHYGVTPQRRGALYPPVAGELPVSYQAFKFAVIGRLASSRAWSITTSEIEAWASGEQYASLVD